MKKIIFNIVLVVLFLIINTKTQAQGSPDDRPKIEYSSKDVSGIFYYDIDDTVEEIKVKEDEQDYLVAKALKKYNNKVKKIEFLNTENFRKLDEVVNTLFNSAPNKNNPPPKKIENKEDLIGVIKRVKNELNEEELVLNNEMAALLSSKQNKKWLKYQKDLKRNLIKKPKQPSSGVGKMSRNGFGQSPLQQRGMINNGIIR